jgi:hypothetical protein
MSKGRVSVQYSSPDRFSVDAWTIFLRLSSPALGRDFLTGVRTGPESAQEDLDEAWEIAGRGPMKLFLADIHLHLARLFFREKEYPWHKNPDGSARGPKDDLAATEKLINACG